MKNDRLVLLPTTVRAHRMDSHARDAFGHWRLAVEFLAVFSSSSKKISDWT
jgi:hypothetical protein